ncbi:MAG: N-acetyltransferase [Anaerolineales bacterium]|jgi:putative acetyltransferase|nr:N-acetyltransferase [Anaerolineales bacterium]
MLNLRIRPERPADIPAIRAVHQAAFSGEGEGRLVELLRLNGKADISLVAEVDGQVIGQVLFSPVTITGSARPLRGLGLAPVGVLPAYQKQGAGTGMIQLGLKMANLRGYDYCVVLGDPAYYQRFGFQTAARYGLDNEYGVDDEFMALEFRRGCLSDAAGLVQYGPEFKQLGV